MQMQIICAPVPPVRKSDTGAGALATHPRMGQSHPASCRSAVTSVAGREIFYIIKVLWSTVISDEVVATAFSRGGRNRHVCVIATASKGIEPKGIFKQVGQLVALWINNTGQSSFLARHYFSNCFSSRK